MDAGETAILKVRKKLDSDSLDEEKVCAKSRQNFLSILYVDKSG